MKQHLRRSNELESNVGMKYYWTSFPGVQGTIKLEPEDFIVQEILPDGQIAPLKPDESIKLPGEPGLFVHAILVKRKMDHFNALKHISRYFRIREADIETAGIKDTYALTSQRISLWLGSAPIPQAPIRLVHEAITLFNFERRRNPVYMGELEGNMFTITLRNVISNYSNNNDLHREVMETLKQPLPNYFGIQRFGVTRPISHLVGKALFLRDYKKAVELFLGGYSPYEPADSQAFRKKVRSGLSYQELVDLCPHKLQPEKRMLKQLASYSKDYLGAIKTLPKTLISLMLYAYQSYLFNRYLSHRLEQDPFHPIEGERLRNGFVEAVVPGDQRLGRGEMRSLYESILQEEGFDKSSLQAPQVLKIRVKRFWRPLMLTVLNPHVNYSQQLLRLKFALNKGQYATTVLREILKSSPLDHTATSIERKTHYKTK